MANNSSPNRSLWLASGVSLAVVIAGAAIISAPSVVDCFNSTTSFGTCMRAKMADAGLVPRTATIAPGEQTSGTGPAGEPSKSAAAPQTLAQNSAGAGSTNTPQVAAPVLGLVRAEPDGSLVIAGSAAPGSTVEIYANDQLIGTAKTDPSGDWALVPEAPLAPGGYEIRVVDPKDQKSAAQSVVVAINADKTSEPLVVATVPGKASEILQGLGTASAPQIATAQQPAEPQPQAQTQTQTASAQSGNNETPGQTAVLSAQADASANAAPASASPTVEASAPAAAAGGQPPATGAVPASEPAQIASAQPETATPTPNTQDVVGDVGALQKRIDALAAKNPPTIDAIEIDGAKNYFAGTGAEGATMRVYVDNKFVGDAKVSNGHWLLETGKVLIDKSQRVRVDQLVAGSAQVAGRAEVNFVFNGPDTAPQEAPPQTAPSPQDNGQTAIADAGNIKVPAPDFALGSTPPKPVVNAGAAPSAPSIATAPGASSTTNAPQPAAGITQKATPTTGQAQTTAETQATAQTQATGQGQATAQVQVPPANFAIDTQKPVPFGSASSGSAPAPVVPKPDFSVATGVPVVEGGSGAPGTATMTAPAPGNSAGSRGSSAVAQTTEAGQTPAGSGEPILVPVPDFSINTEVPAPVPAPETKPANPVLPDATAPATGTDQTSNPDQVPTMVAEPVGNPGDERFAAGRAIIRRGDNLWSIARRVYGHGMRYTTIYQANRGQIRNPNLIYPGQVFALPTQNDPAGQGVPTGGN